MSWVIVWLSVGYTMDTLFFAWLDTPVDIDASVLLPQFTFVGSHLYDCSQNYTAGQSVPFYVFLSVCLCLSLSLCE